MSWMRRDNSIVSENSFFKIWRKAGLQMKLETLFLHSSKDELQTTIRHLKSTEKYFTMSRFYCWILAQKFMFINENCLLNFFCARLSFPSSKKFCHFFFLPKFMRLPQQHIRSLCYYLFNLFAFKLDLKYKIWMKEMRNVMKIGFFYNGLWDFEFKNNGF